MRAVRALVLLLAAATLPAANNIRPADYASDARALDGIIAANYAYLDRFAGGRAPDSAVLNLERESVHDSRSLLHYAEDKLAALADHHAIAGSSFSDSWAMIPTYADLWVIRRGDDFVIDAVRDGSPAARAGIAPGDRLVAIDGKPIGQAVAAFWRSLGLSANGDERAAYAARVLAAGRRDRPRHLTVVGRQGRRDVSLPNLYMAPYPDLPPISIARRSGKVVIRFNNSLGGSGTIDAFDSAMAGVPADTRVVLDLTNVPSGGNTTVARAVMGWFVTKATSYQVHRLPAEERETGIPRQWIEQVLPRAAKHHPLPVAIRVGRWTGSMGEGMAIGFAAMGVPVCGHRMAGLRGAIYDFKLPASGLKIELPAERLYTVHGVPREKFVPQEGKGCPD